MTRSSLKQCAPSPEGSPRASLTTQLNPQNGKLPKQLNDGYTDTKFRYWLPNCSCTKKRLLVTFISFALFLVFLDVVILVPNFGYINDDCYLSPKKIRDLQTAVLTIAEIFEKYNQTYWIDYGTLLGAHRIGDILPHDGDADISRLILPNTSQEQDEAFMDYFAFELKEKIGATTEWQRYVHYNGVNLDLARWVLDEDQNIYRYIPGYPVYTQIRRNFPGKPLPAEWFIPTGKIKFHGKMVASPHKIEAVLYYHYGNTVNVTVPYKRKCWLKSLFASTQHTS